jgi:hypothetical protein
MKRVNSGTEKEEDWRERRLIADFALDVVKMWVLRVLMCL